MVLLIGIASLMTFILVANAQTGTDTCLAVVENPDITTDSSTVDYELTAELVIDENGDATIVYSAEYLIEGSATLDDYGMVYAAARVYFRENPDYEWESIQDLMEVGTIIQNCGETDGDFTSIQLLDESVSMSNDGVPTLSSISDTGWMYTYFFEPITVTVNISETQVVSVSGTATSDFSTEGTYEIVCEEGVGGTIGILDENGDFVAISLTPDDGTTLTCDGITGEVVITPALTLSTSISESISATNAEFEYQVGDDQAIAAVEEWQETVIADCESGSTHELLNEDCEFIDNTSADFGGEEEGPLQFHAATNGQFDEGRTNEFDCPGQGNSCHNKSANAQNNGYVGDVNKFGCIGRGNSCNAKDGKAKDAALNANGK